MLTKRFKIFRVGCVVPADKPWSPVQHFVASEDEISAKEIISRKASLEVNGISECGFIDINSVDLSPRPPHRFTDYDLSQTKAFILC